VVGRGVSWKNSVGPHMGHNYTQNQVKVLLCFK
jgi:hypothetical protein